MGENLGKLTTMLEELRSSIVRMFLKRLELADDAMAEELAVKPLTCQTCGKQFRSLKGYNNHIRRHIGREEDSANYCTECRRAFNTQRQLARHQLTVHRILVPTSCVICNQHFDSENSLAKHNAEVHSKKAGCRICDKQFFSQGKLAVHMKNVHDEGLPEQNFICEFCPRIFKSKEQLRQHQKSHEGMIHSCKLCDKSFRWDSSLNSHIQAAHSHTLPTFNCPECKKSFRDKNNYKKHLFTHTEVKPYYCSICNKGYIRRDLLRKHEASCSPSFEEREENVELKTYSKPKV